MKPAAPVTRSFTASSLAPGGALIVAGLLRVLAKLVDLLAMPLDLLRALQQVEDALAVAELKTRVRQVVARVRLGDRPRPLELRDGRLEQRQRVLEVAGLHELESLVVEGDGIGGSGCAAAAVAFFGLRRHRL